ncbi:Proteasome subunit alpha type-5 [Fagus crenata]
MAFSLPVSHWVDAIREEQQVRSQLQQLIQWVQSGEAVGPWESQLPIIIGDHNELRVRPMAILDRRKRRNVEEVLVQWQGLPTSEATWENLTAMKSQFPEYALKDKGHRKGKGV